MSNSSSSSLDWLWSISPWCSCSKSVPCHIHILFHWVPLPLRSQEYIIENDRISFKRWPLSSTSRNQNARSGVHHLHIENILRLTPDWPPILATPSEEEKATEHVLVNENNQRTTTTVEHSSCWAFSCCWDHPQRKTSRNSNSFPFVTSNQSSSLSTNKIHLIFSSLQTKNDFSDDQSIPSSFRPTSRSLQ